MFHWTQRGDASGQTWRILVCKDKQDYKCDNKTMPSLLLGKKSSFLGTDGLMPVNLPFFQ